VSGALDTALGLVDMVCVMVDVLTAWWCCGGCCCVHDSDGGGGGGGCC